MSRQPSRLHPETGSRPPDDGPPASNADSVTSAPPDASTMPFSSSRRRLLASAGTTGILAVSGCLSALGSSGESNTDVGLTLDRLALADGFAEEAASIAEVYGEHGVWGLADGPSVDGPAYVGALRDSLSVPRDESGSRGREDPWVTADVAAVVYRLDGGAYRVWLWAGARARQPDGGLGRSSVTRVSVGATAGDGWALAGFAPRGSFRAGPVPVSLDDRGPAGRTPLPGGGIGAENDPRTGPNGRFEVAWQGIARGTRSVNAVCEFEPGDDGADDPLEVVATFGVSGGRGAF